MTLHGSDQFVVLDLTDMGHPTTLSTLGALLKPRFVSATTLSYADGNSVYTVPLSGSPRTLVATSDESLADFTWSPDGKTLAYEAMRISSDAASTLEIHIVSDGKDRIMSSMPGPPAVYGCETQECADRLNSHFAYSPDGRFISAAQNLRPAFRLWTADGGDRSPSYAATDTPFMLVWSGSNLYFRDSKGVEVYRNGAVSLTLPAVAWIRPKASPAGDQVVYEARDGSGLAHTYVVSTTSALVTDIGEGRAEPSYLTSRYIWFAGERVCTSGDQCMLGPTIATGIGYIHDLQTGMESTSTITGVADVWPRAA